MSDLHFPYDFPFDFYTGTGISNVRSFPYDFPFYFHIAGESDLDIDVTLIALLKALLEAGVDLDTALQIIATLQALLDSGVDLDIIIGLIAVLKALLTVEGGLSVIIKLTAILQSLLNAVGGLDIAVRLIGILKALLTVEGGLAVIVGLVAILKALLEATGGLDIAIQLIAILKALLEAVGGLDVIVGLIAVLEALLTSEGGLDVIVQLVAVLKAYLTSEGGVTAVVQLIAQLEALLTAEGGLTVAIYLIAVLNTSLTAIGDLTVTVELEPEGEELMATQVKIDDIAVLIKKGSLIVENRIEERSIANFTIVDLLGTTYYKGQAVLIYDPNNVLIFGGVIDNPETVRMAPEGGFYHPITCTDYHYFADKRLVVASYAAGETCGFIVDDIFDNYLAEEGVTITATSIQAGPIIAEAVFNYGSVSEAYDALAELAGFTWFIDENKVLYFIDRTTNVAPWTATPSNIDNALLSGANPLYRNKQYVRGGTGLTDPQVETFSGNGQTVAFTVGYPIASVPTVNVVGVGVQDMGIKGLETGEDCYWSKGDATIVFDALSIPPAIANNIVVTYVGEYPLISLAINEGSQIALKAIEGSGTGIVESIVDEAYHESKDSSLESAGAKLLHYCRDAAKLSYSTVETGLKAGQFQPVDYPLLGLDEAEMLIESVMTRVHTGNLSYDVVTIQGPAMGGWTKFFSTILRRQTASLHIGAGRLLVLLQEGEDLDLAEAPTRWEQEKGEYCWAVKTNGAGLREARWDFFTWG